MSDNEKITVGPAETEQTEQKPDFELKLVQLAVAVRAIDVCSARGAFQGSEMAAVGSARNDIEMFLKASGFSVYEEPAPQAEEVSEEE